jgi:serine/threonine protein kinase/TolB-like protein/Flp pilus assembly protein TadD
MIGKRLAHYDVLEKIGSGGMGEVYRARDTRLDRDVALKILPPEMARDPDRRARFEREARAIAALKHPNIITIHAVEEDGDVRFLAMEFVEGRTLTRAIPAGGLAIDSFLDLAIPLAAAVAAAHAKGITHRDLKPDNVMIEPDGRLKVLDFGLAKLLEVGPGNDATVVAGPGATQDGHILGTVAYMSPEQAEGKPVDPRSDVFSLGILLYEMITGERPFQGDTQISTITSILRDAPRPVHERRHDLPRQLDRILQRCLEKDPDRRYETARGLRNDLETLRTEVHSQPRASEGASGSSAHDRAASWPTSSAGRSVSQDPAALHASSLPPNTKRIARRRLPAWVLVAGLAAVLVGAWLVARGREGRERAPLAPPPSPAPPLAAAAAARPAMIVVFAFENLGPADDAYFAAGISEEITSRLAMLQGLGVISRTSAAQYDRTGKTMQQIATDLGVDFVLDGSVRWARKRDGTSQVRITPQLVRARDDLQVWSNSYDRSMDEIFRIQSEIAAEVVGKLGMTLVPKEREALAAAPSTNVEAYHAYLRAHDITNSVLFLREPSDRALALLEEACTKDPQFLRAHAEMGKLHAGYAHFAWDASEGRLARSKAALDHALALDPQSPWTHWGLGYYYYWGRKDYENAFAEFSMAQEGLPSSVEVLTALAFVRRRQGKFDDAALYLEKAIPLDPQNALAYFSLGETEIVLRRYDQARQNLERVIEISADAHTTYSELARVGMLSGDVAAARRALEKAEGLLGTLETRVPCFWTSIACREFASAVKIADSMPAAENSQFAFECRSSARGWALHFQGNAPGARSEFERARSLLESYVREHPEEANARSELAIVLAHLGQADEALREARMALGLYPAPQDAWIRQYRIFDLAVVEMLTGHHGSAIERLGELLSQPSNQVSVDLLRLSPLFDPLREHSGFARLLTSS